MASRSPGWGCLTGMSCLLWRFGRRVSVSDRRLALDGVGAAAEHRDALPVLVGDLAVVDAGAAGLRQLEAAGREQVALARRRHQVDREARGDGEFVVRVAGVGEGGV